MRFQSQCLAILFFTSVFLCGCTRAGGGQDNLNAVLWVQTSVEYTATTTGIYEAATTELRRVVEARADAGRPLAVVLDLDETILDNSRYKAHELLVRSQDRRKSWDQWIALRNATAVPGAVEFVRVSQELGVAVYVITNRRCEPRLDSKGECPQQEDSLANLLQTGLKIDDQALLFRGERPPEQCLELLIGAERETGSWSTADKTSRRACVRHDFDVVLIAGDQLSDFVGDIGNSTLESRDALQSQYQHMWGRTWFMIPNPTYGAWFRLLYPDRRSHLIED